MLGARQKQQRSKYLSRTSTSLGRPRARYNPPPVVSRIANNVPAKGYHPLTDVSENERLHAYDSRVKNTFDNVVPTLKKISALQHEADFESRAQDIARDALGFGLPQSMLADAWVQQLDMKSLFAWCLFESYRRFSDEFFTTDPLGANNDKEFETFLQSCGFHTLDVSPCADGRLAHVIRYVLRLPYRSVRRRSYAGALFDIEDSLDKWVETELKRFREGKPDTADSSTRYLKAVVYHHSSVDPEREGCAAHGSNTELAAQAGIDRLLAFKQAVENTHCCGASIDCLLIGLDTDTDAIRVHVSDIEGGINPEVFIDAGEIYHETKTMPADATKQWTEDFIQGLCPTFTDGMVSFITYLIMNNISQIEYVNSYHGANYSDIGHAERFIGAGIGFEEVQLRNLTYFAYLSTVEEAAQDLDVGISIFNNLNVSHGLPVPIVVRFDYHGNVPGSRERAIEHCDRVASAIRNRYETLCSQGLLHTMSAIRDVNLSGKIEVLACSVNAPSAQESH